MLEGFLRILLAIAVVLVLGSAVTAADSTTPKPIIENDHVRVTRVVLPVGGTLPTDNKYDVLTVQLGDGETALLEPGQLEKNTAAQTGQVHFFVGESRRSLKNISKKPVEFVEVQFLRSQGKYVAFDLPPSHYCNPGAQKACVTEKYLFCTDRFCTESVMLDPGAISTQHTHAADYIVFATSDFTWHEEPVGKPANDQEFKLGDVRYIEAGGTHRLINTGKNTARLFVVQFK